MLNGVDGSPFTIYKPSSVLMPQPWIKLGEQYRQFMTRYDIFHFPSQATPNTRDFIGGLIFPSFTVEAQPNYTTVLLRFPIVGTIAEIFNYDGWATHLNPRDIE